MTHTKFELSCSPPSCFFCFPNKFATTMTPTSCATDPRSTENYPHRMPRVIFLDSGGVINDNDRRAPQWIHHLEQYMPRTRLGGSGPYWARANSVLTKKLFQGETDRMWDKLLKDSSDFKDFDRRYNLYWIQSAVELVNTFLKEEYEQAAIETIQDGHVENGNGGVKEKTTLVQVVLPETEEEQIKIARDAHLYCTAIVQADYPGAVDAILKLKFEQGFEMYTCSGESATELELTFRTLRISTLTASTSTMASASASISTPISGAQNYATATTIDLQPVFTKLYGPDLIGCHKSSSRFYELIFQDSGVDPRDAVVVDDKEYILAWAKVHGARTVMISAKSRLGKELKVEVEEDGEDGVTRKKEVLAVDHQLSSLAELPVLTAAWRAHLNRAEDDKEA